MEDQCNFIPDHMGRLGWLSCLNKNVRPQIWTKMRLPGRGWLIWSCYLILDVLYFSKTKNGNMLCFAGNYPRCGTVYKRVERCCLNQIEPARC